MSPAAAHMPHDLTEAGVGLVDSTSLLRGILATSGDCIAVLDLEGRFLVVSDSGRRLLEIDDVASLTGSRWSNLWSDATAAQDAIAAARRGGAARFRGEPRTPKGMPRFFDVQVSTIARADGQPAYILAVARDISGERQLKAALDQQTRLAGELQHRIKNTLAMAASIANQTLRGDDLATAAKAFSGRLMTLSHAHDILTRTSWSNVPIRDVVESTLASQRAGSIHVDGPDLLLQPKQALALTIALHELATNAVRYGALSTDGRVDVRWSRETGETPSFRFRWSESGGPSVSEPPPEKKGFGSRLIERMLASDFNGEVSLRYEPGGLVCELVAPLKELGAQGSGHT